MGDTVAHSAHSADDPEPGETARNGYGTPDGEMVVDRGQDGELGENNDSSSPSPEGSDTDGAGSDSVTAGTGTSPCCQPSDAEDRVAETPDRDAGSATMEDTECGDGVTALCGDGGVNAGCDDGFTKDCDDGLAKECGDGLTEDRDGRLAKGCGDGLTEDCDGRLAKGCDDGLTKDCDGRLAKGCDDGLTEDCDDGLIAKGCSDGLTEDCDGGLSKERGDGSSGDHGAEGPGEGADESVGKGAETMGQGAETIVQGAEMREAADGCSVKEDGDPWSSKASMEKELAFLRGEVRSQSAVVRRLQTSLYEQQVGTNVALVSLRTQLRRREREVREERSGQEQRMAALLSHLLYLEGAMRRDQRHTLELLADKDDVIRRQKSAIEDLAARNAKLLAALKELHGYTGPNGVASAPSPTSNSSPEDDDTPTPVTTPTHVKTPNTTPAMTPTHPVVLRNKDRGGKVRFSSMKDKLRRHRSSLELHRPASLETLLEGSLRYSSQENLTHTPTTPSSTEGLSSDQLKKSRLQERKERCRSMVDYPFRLNDLPEVSTEVERGRGELPLTDPLHASLLLSGDSEEDDATGSPGGDRQYGELAKSTSMPQSLSGGSELEGVAGALRERPHSLAGMELNLGRSLPPPHEKVSLMPSPTSLAPPGAAENNPFKSIKNVFRRRNSKQRSKKRPVSLGQQTNQEYHEALKEHFKKYDLS